MEQIVAQATGLRRRSEVSEWLLKHYQLVVVAVASLIYLTCIISPPSLMDDVDSVQASIAHTMLKTGDWVTPHLDGIRYLEKPPLKYWLTAIFFKLFGVSDVVARLPMALFAVLLCWLTARMAAWAGDRRTGLISGLILATSVGLFLFTRVLISDVALTFTIAFAIWSFLRALDDEETRPRLWSLLFGASVGTGLLFKGLIAAVFPIASGFLYLLFTRRLLERETWRRLMPFRSALVGLAIAAPWHIIATLRNPPAFYASFQGGPGQYHGFFWFYFFNEHILRFLNRRYPRDYNTVPRALFWLLHLVWFFPWSVYFPTLFKLRYRAQDRGSSVRLMCLCWIGFLMFFFSFSSTQEYYSMPCYPAVAILLGFGIVHAQASAPNFLRRGDQALGLIATLAAGIIAYILASVWRLPAPGDISQALAQHRENYTLSMGHAGDLTLASFAYLRGPLLLAGLAFSIGAAGMLLFKCPRRIWAGTLMMIVFFHAARLALVTFDPYMSSRPLADALLKSPPGKLIVDDQYYSFSSVFFYTDRTALLLNGRVNNLEYGSYAPGSPDVFIHDSDLPGIWHQQQRWYLVADGSRMRALETLVGADHLFVLRESGGKYLLTNYPIREVAARGVVSTDVSTGLIKGQLCQSPVEPVLEAPRHSDTVCILPSNG
jgi:4-amino-4-deoxy-L-arabinose transferase-like glycosyltransferase